jgi:hypothetical protein
VPYGAIGERKNSSQSQRLYKPSHEELIEGIDAVGDGFHKMMMELNEIEDMINGKDIVEMEGLMDVTNEYMDEHIKFSEKLQEQIMGIN